MNLLCPKPPFCKGKSLELTSDSKNLRALYKCSKVRINDKLAHIALLSEMTFPQPVAFITQIRCQFMLKLPHKIKFSSGNWLILEMHHVLKTRLDCYRRLLQTWQYNTILCCRRYSIVDIPEQQQNFRYQNTSSVWNRLRCTPARH